MKLSHIQNSALSGRNYKEASTNDHKNHSGAQSSNTSFQGATDLLINFWDGVERGGLATSFIIQDVIGTGIPRTISARNIGKEYTGKNNWTAVAENALREALTGPTMFAVPAAVLYGTMKAAGKAHGVPVESIRDLSQIVIKNAKDIDTSSIEGFKKDFYRHVLNSAFSNFDSQNNLDMTKYTEDILKMQGAPKKGLFKNILGKMVPDSREDLLQGIVNTFVKDKKANTKGYPDFLSAKISKSSSEIGFENLLDRMNKYSDDLFNALKKSSDPNNIASEFVENFSKKRMGGRFITNAAMGVFAAAAMWFIPKIYTLSKTNPETDAVRQKASGLKDDGAAKTENNGSEVSFSGGGISKIVSDLGEKVAPGLDGRLSRIAPKIESNWINVARPIFLALVTVFTLVPRMIQSVKRDMESSKKNGGPVQWDETSNILRRDLTTIVTILFAMKGLGSVMAHGASKANGIILTNKILPEKTGIFKKIGEFFNPEGGVKVLSKKQIASQMSSFADGDELARFFENTQAKHGNLHKMLNIDAKSKKGDGPLLYNAAQKLFGKDLIAKEDLSAKELKQVLEQKANSSELKDMLELLNDNTKNPLLKFANKINMAIQTTSFAIVMAFLGFGLPKLNDLIIKKKYLKDNKTLTPKYQDPGMRIPDFGVLNNLKPQEKEAFQFFLGNPK